MDDYHKILWFLINRCIFSSLLILCVLMLVVACGGGGGGGGGSSFKAGDLGTPDKLNITDTSVSSVSLSWKYSGPADSTSGFNVYRDGDRVSSTPLTSMTDIQLWPSTKYCYRVSAYNFWSESNKSNDVCATTLADSSPPSTPHDVVVYMEEDSGAILRWGKSRDNHQIAGYKVYRDLQELMTVVDTSAVDTSTSANAEYCYSVSAFDSFANESEASTPVCVDTDWTTDIIDENSEIGGGLDIALDSLTNSHVIYFDKTHGEIKHAKQSNGDWAILSLDYIGNENRYPDTSLSLDSDNLVHSCYFDTKNHELKYVHIKLGTPSIEIIDNGDSIRNECAIAADIFNNLHIIFIKGGYLYYSNNLTGSWISSAVPDSFGASRISLAIDSLGKAHISYSTPGPEIYYLTNQFDNWQINKIDSGAIRTGGLEDTSIDVDSNDKVHIVYGCYGFSSVRYANNIDGNWSPISIVNKVFDGCYPSVAADNLNKIHISYRDGDISTDSSSYLAALKYITNKSGNWVDYTIKTGGIVGFYSEIAVDRNFNANIVSLNNFHLEYDNNR